MIAGGRDHSRTACARRRSSGRTVPDDLSPNRVHSHREPEPQAGAAAGAGAGAGARAGAAAGAGTGAPVDRVVVGRGV